MIEYMQNTKAIIRLSHETIYSLDELRYVKYYGNLTDFGLEHVCIFSQQMSVSLWSILNAINRP